MWQLMVTLIILALAVYFMTILVPEFTGKTGKEIVNQITLAVSDMGGI